MVKPLHNPTPYTGLLGMNTRGNNERLACGSTASPTLAAAH